MKVFTPPIKSQGIKTKLVPWIKQVVPKDFDGTWIEPFMGTGVVAFNIRPKKAILADTNPHLINFYNSLKDNTVTPNIVRAFLEDEGKKLEDIEDYYYQVRERFNIYHSPLDFLFINRAGFNGMIRFNSKGKHNVPFCKKPKRFSKAYITKIVNQVDYVYRLLKQNDYTFLCQDFQKTINEAKSKDIIYCDPPYIDRHVDYFNSWNENDEYNLYDSLKEFNGKFVLSTWHNNRYRKNSYIDSLWSNFYMFTKEHFYHLGGKENNRNSMIEAIITNYNVDIIEEKKIKQFSLFDKISFNKSEKLINSSDTNLWFALAVVLSLPLSLYSESVIVPSDSYNILEDKNITYIYSKEYEPLLDETKDYQKRVIDQYSKEFGFSFDDRLRVGLASLNNQIVNGFSTQIPFNSQLFYGVGASEVDYFCTPSWIKGLIVHETAHNFQLNPKDNQVSKVAHKIVGNAPYTNLGLFVIFPIPNLMINSFILEGNAVLNESRFGIGGRLYSGYALAEVITMAKANKIRPELMYNTTLNFPYRESYYLIGGFFQKFLAQKYGVKKVNSYFKIHSRQILPFFVNSTFKETFGKNFETLLHEFVEDIKTKYSSFKYTQGKEIIKTQAITPMSSSKDEVFTLIGDLKSYPKILTLDKKSKRIGLIDGAYRGGKVFKLKDNYYTLSSTKISPNKIKIALIDKDGYALPSTIGKIVQGYLSNGKMVYFDIEKSIDTPQIYIDGEFYDSASSSVYIDKNNLYYFKQQNHKKVLYKNKKPLFSFEGYYGFVTDIAKDGTIYFISLSQNGSTAYSYKNGAIKRVSSGDDIIDIKLINNQEALVATINADGYSYKIIKLNPILANIPKPDFSIEDTKIVTSQKSQKNHNPKKEYNPITNLEYSSLEQFLGYGNYEGFILDLKANFYDPLMQNSMSLISSINKQRVVGGIGYSNNAHLVEFGAEGFLVSHNDDYDHLDKRDNGYSGYLELPLITKGYWRAFSRVEYTKDWENIYRKPLSLSLDISNTKKFGISKYPNSKNSLGLFLSSDRGDSSYGGAYSFGYGFDNQIFLSFDTEYMKSDIVDTKKEKGIEINSYMTDIISDKATIIMPTINNKLYAKEVKTAEFGIYKVLDKSLYSFSFPLSIQRESLYLKEKIYDIDFINRNKQYSESTFGVEGDFVFFNNFVMPIKFELLYNPDTKDKTKFRAFLSEEF